MVDAANAFNNIFTLSIYTDNTYKEPATLFINSYNDKQLGDQETIVLRWQHQRQHRGHGNV